MIWIHSSGQCSSFMFLNNQFKKKVIRRQHKHETLSSMPRVTCKRYNSLICIYLKHMYHYRTYLSCWLNSRIKPWMYIGVVLCMKSCTLLARTGLSGIIALCLSIRKVWLNSRIKSRMYVRHCTIYGSAHA